MLRYGCAAPRLTLPDLPGAERYSRRWREPTARWSWRRIYQRHWRKLPAERRRRTDGADRTTRRDVRPGEITALGLAYLRECLQVARAEGAVLSDSVPEEIIAGFLIGRLPT